MSNNTMLILIGGRSAVPTISGVLQFLDEINRVKFLVCEADEYKKLQDITDNFIRNRKNNTDFTSEVETVDPNDFGKVSDALARLTKEEKITHASLASAPQAMSIASYDFLRSKFPRTIIFTVSTDQASIIPLHKGSDAIPFKDKLSVEDYILACGQNIFRRGVENSFTFQNIEKFGRLTSYFAENIESVDPILTEIRKQAGQGGDKIKSIHKVVLSSKFADKSNLLKSFIITFLEELQKYSLIDKLVISPEISFRINPDSYSFLQGDWLELFVYLKASECRFDSLEPSVEMSEFNGEIDLFCLHNSNALICECKTGQFSKKEVFKIRNKAEKLGESYCIKVLISSAMSISKDLVQEAFNSKVKVFTGKDLLQLSQLLKNEMNDPTYRRR